MTIELSDAIGRAELMSDDGLLSQQAYELILQKINDDDRHSFTLALVDRGIIVKTSEKKEKEAFDAKKLAKGVMKRMK